MNDNPFHYVDLENASKARFTYFFLRKDDGMPSAVRCTIWSTPLGHSIPTGEIFMGCFVERHEHERFVGKVVLSCWKDLGPDILVQAVQSTGVARLSAVPGYGLLDQEERLHCLSMLLEGESDDTRLARLDAHTKKGTGVSDGVEKAGNRVIKRSLERLSSDLPPLVLPYANLPKEARVRSLIRDQDDVAAPSLAQILKVEEASGL